MMSQNCSYSIEETKTNSNSSRSTTQLSESKNNISINKNNIKFNSFSNGLERQSQSLHDLFLEIIDILLSCFLITPCVVAYWCATWQLMNIFIFPKNQVVSVLVSFIIGSLGYSVFTFTQHYLTNNIHPDKHRLTYYFMSRSYTYTFGLVCVNMWRGIWTMCLWLTNNDFLTICIIIFITIIILICTRTVRNLFAAPYVINIDNKYNYFEVAIMLKIRGFKYAGHYIIDSLFSIFVIGPLLIIAWCCLWNIMDIILYPNNNILSAWSSLILGYGIVFLTYMLQPIVRWLTIRIVGIEKLIICDLYYIAEFFGSVNTWRGIWMLLVINPQSDSLKTIISIHFIPFLILMALRCSNTLINKSIYIDADGTANECIEIPIHYIRRHFQNEREKKQILL